MSKLNKFIYVILLSAFIFPLSSQAYIPPYWMIMSRTSDNHGKGIYLVDQDVIFNHGAEIMVVNERWTVQNEGSFRLEVTGLRELQNKIRLTYVYQNNRRYFIDENGVRKAEKIPNDFFEPYFHFRVSKNIKPVLVAQKIAPAISLKSDPHRYSAQKPHQEPEPYVRLARVGGGISYAIGTPTPLSSAVLYPGIWVEQDQFVIRKLRLNSQLEIAANDYKDFSGGLLLPKERILRWQNRSAKINLKSAIGVSANPKIKTSLEATSLNFGDNPNLSLILPSDETIRYFYTNLR